MKLNPLNKHLFSEHPLWLAPCWPIRCRKRRHGARQTGTKRRRSNKT